MAGNYPDVPGHRFVLDKDGTQLYKINAGVVTQLTNADLANLNRDVDTVTATWTAILPSSYVMLYFPEPRTINGSLIVNGSQSGPTTITAVQYSTNTTNGTDGTWATLHTAPSVGLNNPTSLFYRTNIVSTGSVSNVRAIRFLVGVVGSGSQFYHWHVYGEIPPASNPNRVAIWNPSTDVAVTGAYFDWGDSPRSSSADKTFRVKNLSSTLTANSIVMSADALTDGSPSIASSHYFSTDGTNFTETVNIGTLAPGAISATVWVRRVLASNAPLGTWAPRMKAEAASWT